MTVTRGGPGFSSVARGEELGSGQIEVPESLATDTLLMQGTTIRGDHRHGINGEVK